MGGGAAGTLVAAQAALRRHAMPFGAEVLGDGGVRFRLWAPGAREVLLVLEDQPKPMVEVGEGWYELVEKARPGALYRYRIDGKHDVPDPASRFQPRDVDGPSEVIDPLAFEWQDEGWRGRPWAEAVIYELHVGTFTSQGTYAGVSSKLDYLRDLGVTAIELMPLSDFAGRRNWGYDGVLPYAPDAVYGRPEELKALVQAAHQAGLMVFLDVVYNHFGPKGNYLGLYAPQFFTAKHQTPWGAAIDFSVGTVREYFIRNALYWLEEYRFDGLRFDAVHAIVDESPRHVLEDIAAAVHARDPDRHVHLVLENDANQARFLAAGRYDAQWNDDWHHACHVLATGESDGYYAAYAGAPARHLARALAEGFAYQGEVSPFSNAPRGEPSAHLPPRCFVDFLQNHDQVGNRAYGERLASLADEGKLKLLSSILLLAPSPPLVFMGEEWACHQPFLFFCDFDGELGEAVRNGRREEFARFAAFADAKARARIPDPLSEQTFRRCVLRWKDARGTQGRACLAHYRQLLQLRRAEIAPRKFGPGRHRMLAERAFEVAWDGLVLRANFSDASIAADAPAGARLLWGNGNGRRLDPWTASWWIA
ncbi:MAG TPA: malto-oligosyltrehalose trehalohydrolase [Burkholderiales bacterium]|nr:malto-oligosyltrehalose trehalohydrolase [Burkholderiales bacterium]